MLQNNIH